MLSEVAQLFDPLGIISPVVVNSKILLQELWLQKISWDEQLSDSIARKWLQLREDLARLDQISIPRSVGIVPNSSVEHNGFSDASQRAMTAVLYMKIISLTTRSIASFLIPKTKVAPLKRQSIPRLELGAAVLLSKLVKHICDHAKLIIANIYLWTDAKVALAWIHSHPSRWKDFVGNRVALIQELVPTAHWRHVSGLDNPADCASRGLSTDQLKCHHLWWHGLPWLLKEESDWPSQLTSIEVQNLPEVRKTVILKAAITPQKTPWDLIDRYSSLTQLIRVTELVMLACNKLKNRGKTQSQMRLTTELLTKARLFWIKETQRVHFHSELAMLKHSQVPRNHVLTRLTAFIYSMGIIRVGGRLDKTQQHHYSKHPAILPKSSQLTTLIIRHSHLGTLHGGAQFTLTHIRQNI